MVGGGEGLFAKRSLEVGDLVAIYNGVKVPLTPGAGKEEWEECGYSIGYYDTTTAEHGWGDMDIPLQFRSTTAYRATLCHKLNHSFQNNCTFSDISHPVYGYLPCAVTTKPVSTIVSLFTALASFSNPVCRWRRVQSCLSTTITSSATVHSGTRSSTTSCDLLTLLSI